MKNRVGCIDGRSFDLKDLKGALFYHSVIKNFFYGRCSRQPAKGDLNGIVLLILQDHFGGLRCPVRVKKEWTHVTGLKIGRDHRGGGAGVRVGYGHRKSYVSW